MPETPNDPELNTTDAEVWAQEFCRRFSVAHAYDGGLSPVDDPVGLMIAWFANAIETGRSAAGASDA